jgi:hypothetical protein
VEGIEESQVNDRSIMEATVIERQDHSGRMRFKTTLPSGRDLRSEWIQESDRTKAEILWAEAVRGQIVADSQEAALRARRQLKEVREKAARSAAPVLLGPDGQPAVSSGLSTRKPPLPSQTPAMLVTQPTVSAPADPAAYVRTQHAAARKRLDELKAERERINFEYVAAQKAETQWFGLLQAMGVNTLEETIGSGSVSAGAGSGDVGSVSSDGDDDSPDSIS